MSDRWSGPRVHSLIKRMLLYLVFLYRESTVLIKDEGIKGSSREPEEIGKYMRSPPLLVHRWRFSRFICAPLHTSSYGPCCPSICYVSFPRSLQAPQKSTVLYPNSTNGSGFSTLLVDLYARRRCAALAGGRNG